MYIHICMYNIYVYRYISVIYLYVYMHAHTHTHTHTHTHKTYICTVYFLCYSYIYVFHMLFIYPSFVNTLNESRSLALNGARRATHRCTSPSSSPPSTCIYGILCTQYVHILSISMYCILFCAYMVGIKVISCRWRQACNTSVYFYRLIPFHMHVWHYMCTI